MTIKAQINQYNAELPIESASTPPSSWYTCDKIFKHEQQTVFTKSWIMAARREQFKNDGDYVALDVANQPIVIVKSTGIKAFYNVCRHHAAQVMPNGEGCTKRLTCPYHGWTYQLDGNLLSTPQFGEVKNFNKHTQGLKPVRVAEWQHWVFICLDEQAESLESFLGALWQDIPALGINNMKFHKRVSYQLNCNWKVYVDNYLDGGYHVPFLHKGLNSALNGKYYKIETKDQFCLQSCPTKDRDNEFSKVRTGTARYYWQYPNLMLNSYDGILGLMLVEAISVNTCKVSFDYYFDDTNPNNTTEFKNSSVEVADKVQDEDRLVCESVQKGLASNGYETGRLSVDKEAGEHLFHRLLFRDMS